MKKRNGRKRKHGSLSIASMRKKAREAAERAQELNKGKVGVRINARTVVYCHPEHIEKVKAQFS